MVEFSKDISVLNTLIATTLDSVDGYRKAAEDADSSRFTDVFARRANEREAVVRDLQAKVQELGGNPEDDGSVLAAAHRTFLSIKDAITGKDDQAIINEVERGEDYIKGKYELALQEMDLSVPVKQVIQTAFQSVRAGHDEMSALKHSMPGTAA